MEEYRPLRKVGKLCYHYCSKQSYLPIRDVLNDHKGAFKLEPNYETATYNWCKCCNQPSVRAAAQDGLSHILFVTKYTGNNSYYVGRYFIVGYYEIGWTAKLKGRITIRAKHMCFAPVEKAYEITDERWRRINVNGQSQSLNNLRYATQRISGDLLNEILQHLGKHNAVDDYLLEVARLKAEYNPLKKIPDGRIFIINVGANSSSPLQSPLFDNGKFEFVPIPANFNEYFTYADLRQFNEPGKPMLDLFSKTPITSQKNVHNDPEFVTMTYGDNIKKKSNLRKLQVGDFLFFLARLVPYKGQFDYSKAIFALIGYLEIAEWLDNPDNPLFVSPAFIRNAHIRRWRVDPSSFTNFAIFKGSANSRRFRYAIPFDREFVEFVPILKADGNRWQWGRTTDLGIIGSNTRTVRMHINPRFAKDKERTERFWRHIWELQRWQTA